MHAVNRQEPQCFWYVGSHAYHSRDPGVMLGVSPTLRLLDRLAFFSKFFLAKPYNLELYSFSIAALSR